jgi:hypothetical protein
VRKPSPGTHKLSGGLLVEYRKDGQVHVKAVDRWGAKYDQTFLTPAYFRAAVPVIAKGLTPAQGQELAALARKLVVETPEK